MNTLQAAQSIYNSTIKNLAGKEVELDVQEALAVATFCTGLAQAEAAAEQVIATREQTAQLKRMSDMLGLWLNSESMDVDDDREAIAPGDYRYYQHNDAPRQQEGIKPDLDLPF